MTDDQFNKLLEALHELERVILASGIIAGWDRGPQARCWFFSEADRYLYRKCPPEPDIVPDFPKKERE